ncbi:MAG: PTS sugar transporter subunit IIA [Bacillota bacterium]|nr:PTS sugar transporter subunit IIA [Bacillota bacterium]
MVGILVTGHGQYASGVLSAIELIAGPQKDFVAVNFDGEISQLEEDLYKGYLQLQNCVGVIVFSDLPGGSPFKLAVTVAQQFKNIEVLAGTNFPMLLEIVVSRKYESDFETLVNTAMRIGKKQILHFDLEELMRNTLLEEDDDFSDGI